MWLMCVVCDLTKNSNEIIIKDNQCERKQAKNNINKLDFLFIASSIEERFLTSNLEKL